MSKGWPQVRLGEIITRVSDSHPVEAEQQYPNFGIFSYGRGLFPKPPISGMESSATTLYRVRQDQFIYSRLFAFEGAYGLVTPEFDGCYISNEYPTFDCNRSRLLPEYLGLCFRRPSVWQDVARLSTGIGDRRRRVQPDQFLTHSIPLPPIPEQRRIVANVEELAVRIEEARGLQQKVGDECDGLCRSILMSDSLGSPTLTPMHELVTLRAEDVTVVPSDTYHFAGVYCFGRGVFVGDRKTGLDFAYKSLTRLRTGDFVYPKLMAWEGALGIVPSECDGLCVSPEYPVFALNSDRVLPETLDVHFRTPSVWPQLAEISTGTNVRRRRLHPKSFLAYQMPLPSMETQLKLRAVKTQLASLKTLQTQSAAELDALLPSILDTAFKGEL